MQQLRGVRTTRLYFQLVKIQHYLLLFSPRPFYFVWVTGFMPLFATRKDPALSNTLLSVPLLFRMANWVHA